MGSPCQDLCGRFITPKDTMTHAVGAAEREIVRVEALLAETQAKVVDLSQTLGALQEYRRQHQAALAQLKE